MSWQAHEAVLALSQARGAVRCVLHCLADHARPDGSGTFPSWDTIVREANVSRPSVGRALDWLQGQDEIEQTGTLRSGTKVWRITLVQRLDYLKSGVHPLNHGSSVTEPRPDNGSSILDDSSSILNGAVQSWGSGGSASEPEPLEPSVEPPEEPGRAKSKNEIEERLATLADLRAQLSSAKGDLRAVTERCIAEEEEALARLGAEV